MVSSTTFQEMVSKIDYDRSVSSDYIVPASRMAMESDTMMCFEDHAYPMREIAHKQVATKLKIPAQFYDRIGEHNGLRTTVVNRLLGGVEGNNFVRTIGGEMRALLSDRYKPIDNLDVLNAAAPVLRDMAVDIKSAAISEARMYIQVAFPKLEAEVQVGDAVQYGLTITNSEVGMGMVKVSPTIWRLVCSNGMIRSAEIKHRHIGKQMEMGEDFTIFSDAAIEADRKAFRLKLQDTIQQSVSESAFMQWVDMMKGAVSDPIYDVVKTIKNVSKEYGIEESLQDLMVNNMAVEGNMNRWGICNSITHLAHSTDDKESQYEYEVIGDRVLSIKDEKWRTLAA